MRILAVFVGLLTAMPALAAERQVNERYYPVHGQTVAELNAVIRANAPRGGLSRGMGIIDLDRRYRLEAHPRGCRIAEATVTAKATLILPKWRAGSDPAPGVARHWRGLERRIRSHEYGHVAIAARYARIMETRLLALRNDGRCWLLAAEAGQAIERTLKEHSAAQRAYDARSLGRLTARR